MGKPLGWNGPAVELLPDEDILERASYCVTCGSIFIYAEGRDCPGCTNAATLKELDDRLDDLEERVESVEDIVEGIRSGRPTQQNDHSWGIRDD